MQEVNVILKQRRLKLQMTMLDVAKKVGVSEGTISRWESGDIANMKRDKIVALADALQMSPAVIMGWETPKDTTMHELNRDEVTLLNAYRNNPQMHEAVNKLLGISADSK